MNIVVLGSFSKEWDGYFDGLNSKTVRLLDKVDETGWIGTKLMGKLLQKFL